MKMNVIVQAAAENDVLSQFEWYAERQMEGIARRFLAAFRLTVETLAKQPLVGVPKSFNNAQLAGLRIWPIKGFDKFQICYLAKDDHLTVVRVLHGSRDVAAILDERDAEAQDGDPF